MSTTLKKFFEGKSAPFEKPLVLNNTESSGGRISYFPVPFSKSIKIRSNSTSDSFYWQLNYSLFGEKIIISFNPDLTDSQKSALKNAKSRFNYSSIVPRQPVRTEKIQFSIPAHTSKTDKITGAGVVKRLVFTSSESSLDQAKDLRFRIVYNDSSQSKIDVGLLDLVHLGGKLRQYRSMHSSFHGDALEFSMPIPFENGLDIIIDNLSDTQFSGLEIRVEIDPQQRSNMRLNAFTDFIKLDKRQLLDIAKVRGAGVFCGFNLQHDGALDFQEGNEYISVDDSMIWKGTGTEDYYNCGYYYSEGAIDLPLHGILVKESDGITVSAYRIQKLDAVPFKHNLYVTLEAGCPKKKTGSFPATYRWTAFWYLKTDVSSN